MKAMKVLITAGGTSEKIDEVRVMSNISTGRLGSLIADEFIRKDVSVTYVCGKTAILPSEPGKTNIIKIDSVNELIETITELFSHTKYDAVIHAMAVSDYRPVQTDEKKISSDMDKLVIVMEKTPKVISMLKELQPEIVLVGFKLLVGVKEEELLRVSKKLLSKNDCDYVLANDLEKINGDKHEAILIEADGSCTRAYSKHEIATTIAEKVLKV
jgi:phosphopantothenate-cysteine ligase